MARESGIALHDRARDAAQGSITSAISNRVVQVFAEYAGRGPTKARTLMTSSLITVVLEETLTRGEQKLIEKGHARSVYDKRKVLQAAIREDLAAAVESVTGRRVLAVLGDHQLDPDFAIENFVMEESNGR